MKRFLFGIIVVLLTPLYLIIKFIKDAIEVITDLTEPFAEGICKFVDNMCGFWKKVFKINEEEK